MFRNQSDSNIYSNSSEGHFFSPFSFSIDKMEHLMLVNFEKDPDEYYHTFELQQAVDSDNKKQLLVIAYRLDGKCDIYHQPGYPFASQAAILDEPAFFVQPMEDAVFQINSESLRACFSFEDKYKRQIKVQVIEKHRSEKKPFFLLAPIGEAAKEPSTFPVYSLYGMSFTKKKYTDIVIEINNRNHKPDNFFLPIDWSRNFFTRYSPDTFNIDWNKNTKATLSPLKPDSQDKAYDGDTMYEIEDCNGCREIKRMSTKYRSHEITVEFCPPFADIACLKDNIQTKGVFNIFTDRTKGFINGEYSVKKNNSMVEIQLCPVGGWRPNETRWIIKFLYKMVKVFRKWPASYLWIAKISFQIPEKPYINSYWKRKTEPVPESVS